MRLFHRSFSMIDLPIKYSEGFNPHPKLSIANPLSLGFESECEYMDIEMEEKVDLDIFKEKINKVLPEDIEITNAVFQEKEKSVSAIIAWAFYEIKFELNTGGDIKSLEERINKWLEVDKILITRSRKKRGKKVEVEVNIIPLIGNITVKGYDENNYVILNTLIRSGQNGNLKPAQLMEAMGRDLNFDLDLDSLRVKRIAQYAEKDGSIYSPL